MRNRKRSVVLILVVCLVVVIGLPCYWRIWREVQHERLNRQLIAAICRDDTATALAALEQGADGNARQEQALPLWRTAWNLLRGHPSASADAPTALLLALLHKDAQGHDVYVKENLPLVRALLAHGAQANVRDKYGFTALELTLLSTKYATTRLLVQYGASMKETPGTNDNPLIIACVADILEENDDLIEMMLQHGADPNATEAGSYTPLWGAVASGNAHRVRLLLRYHAVPNVHLLAYAKKYNKLPGMREIAQILREAGVKK